MKPSPNRQAVIVGVFVAFAVAILAGGILTIGDINDTFTRKVTVTTVFDEVGGLQRGDNIWFSGVKVGTVKKLSFHGGSQVEVEMKVDRTATPFIHADALAKLGSDGLIGNKLVVIYAGTPEAPTLQDGDVLAAGTAVSTEEIMKTLQANNDNLLAITTDFKGISAKLARGEGTIGKLLGDDTLYTTTLQTVATLDTASQNARTLTSSLATFSADLNRPGNLPHDLVTDKTTYASLTGTVGDLRHAGEKASTMMDGVAAAVADPGTPIGTLIHDQAAGADVKVTLDNLNRGSVLLADDLEAAQHNFLLRRFFRKREKAAEKEAAQSPDAGAPATEGR